MTSQTSISSGTAPAIARPKGSHDGMARRLLMKVLTRLYAGELVIYEEGQSHRFGGNAEGPLAEIQVHNPRAWRRVLEGGVIAAGESYMDGDWSSSDLTSVTRLFSANLQTMDSMEAEQSFLLRWTLKLAHRLRRNNLRGSRENISAHYDLGNDFFALFLDPTMMYSSALFTDGAATLESAAEAKLDELCRQLELKPEDHLLEIGTGWGGMALHAARHYGCRVTTTTISREQYEYTCKAVESAGLADRITVLCEDYRLLRGQYDKVVSIEMLEAVGHQYYSEYFRRCSELLKPHGKLVIQVITIPDQRYQQARDSVDFIKRYIFPGGCLPSLSVIAGHLAEDSDLELVHLRDITADYAETLAHWRQRFLAQLDAVRKQGFDERFIRMWEYYLCYCEGGFRERIIGTVQFAAVKPGYRVTLGG
ncbi:SAM-dependent methyltransferase [Parahaliea aestuarii]|uniref:Class I SAM-dependent methyltransferase n=1 Tax=Parahaliea aestuarii TaxID=1852021 RepID=A0A5C8ZZ87_9GAMM|nr:cyclopropane-fatty-acyl-phospholipid synthase family protein [Parahaliea aestuarii]TXS92541.1 class I SAM-dependent methyltransferase [Parahaliea aestuarii]